MQTKGKSSGPAGFGQEESIIGPGSSNKQYNQPVTVSTFEETQLLEHQQQILFTSQQKQIVETEHCAMRYGDDIW